MAQKFARKAQLFRNAITHGLLAASVRLQGKTRVTFLELLRSLEAKYQPASHLELTLLTKMAVAKSRLDRLWAFQSHAPVDQSLHPELFSRYETRFSAQYRRALERLTRLAQK